MDRSIGVSSILGAWVTRPAELGRARWLGIGSTLLLLLLLVLLPTLVGVVSVHQGLREGMGSLAEDYEDHLPEIRLQDGELEVLGKDPCLFPDPEDPPEGIDPYEFAVIVDTTGAYTTIPDEYNAGVLLTDSALYVRQQNGNVNDVPLEKLQELVGDVVINGEFFQARRTKWSLLGALIALLFLLVYYLLAKLVHALVLCLLGLVAASGRVSLGFGGSFKIALAALVPAVLLQVLHGLFKLNFSWFWLIYILVGGVYMWIAVRGAARDEDSQEPQVPAPEGAGIPRIGP